ncbi:hypothetical protein [Ruminococcus sp.]|uniref:hypothetical protein n=1 Tax=Ruminococcus sp. TaxID=41978 RepID=UPI0025F16725|nr:hypothetical protein [Ruminococcus sp.]MBQ8967434.1 hypothetical protein [Ruminococcus sp.]
MANALDSTAVMAENLRDMGLCDEDTEKCLEMLKEKRCCELERFLGDYRKTLLENVHKYNERIDCLDYLTYKMKNGGI